MPRRKQRHGDVPALPEALAEGENKNERTAVFERTKMCKFHILGSCTKGESCRFAHDRIQLQSLPDLACTKLCKTLIATGSCFNPTCRYAHCKEELRPVPDPALEGRTGAQSPQPQSVALQNSGMMPSHGPSHGQSMQDNNLNRAFLDNAVMQAAILQMGQAAQAHAAEAARLQIMAAHLQGGAATTAMMQAALSDSMPPFALNGGQVPGGLNVPGPQESRGFLAQHINQSGASTQEGDGLKVTVKNTFLEVSEPSNSFGSLRMINSAAGRLCSLTEGVDASSDSPIGSMPSAAAMPAAVGGASYTQLPPASYGPGHPVGLPSTRSRPVASATEADQGNWAMTRALNVDPVQILPESLRSLSSSSQPLAEEEAPRTSPSNTATSKPSRTIRNSPMEQSQEEAWMSNTATSKPSRTIRNSPLGREHESSQARRKSSSQLSALPEDMLGLAEQPVRTTHWGGLQASSFGAEGVDAGVAEPEPGLPPASVPWPRPSLMANESMAWTVEQTSLPFLAGSDEHSLVSDVNAQHFGEHERQELSVGPCSSGEPVCSEGEQRRRQLGNGAGNTCIGTSAARRRVDDRDVDGDTATGTSVYAPGGPPHMFADMLMTSGVTVKNTFLDFMTDEPVSALRAVQTASGRLDLMGED